MKYDVIIIGAGILGSLVADRLAKYNLEIAIIEKASDSGLEQSMSSSAIVHSGIDPEDGTLKAKYNVLGNRMMAQVCKDLDVDYLECGGYICAHNDEELAHLEKLHVRGYNRSIESKIMSGDKLRTIEPNISPAIKYALSMPTTGVIYPTELTIAAIERASNNGLTVMYETEVKDIKFETGEYTVKTSEGQYQAKYLINCAGMFSDVIAKMVDEQFPITIKPKRGEYFVTGNQKPVVKSVIYPVPNENGKGVLAVPTTHGNVLLGPNGVLQSDREDDSTHPSDLSFVQANVTKILNQFPTDIIKTYAGLRSTGNNGDFYLEPCTVTDQMFNLVAIDSPGIASAPALASACVEWLQTKLELVEKADYNPNRARYLKLNDYSLEKQNQMIADDNLYGKIICRCEQVTEGEIRDAIRKQNGARDLNGIKFRISPMLGMCQGGFCETEVVRILADELGVDISEVYRKGKSTLVLRGVNNERV